MNAAPIRVPAKTSSSPSVLHVAAECLPFAMTGGLGDVLAALPAAQRRIGADARLILPLYGFIDRKALCGDVVAEVAALGRRAQIFGSATGAGGAPLYWCDIPGLLDGCADPYRRADGTELDNLAQRFAGFCEAVARFVDGGHAFAPDIVHVHDWHAALLPAWLRQLGWSGRCVQTIHNLAFKGIFGDEVLRRCALPRLSDADIRADLGGSFLKSGIAFSDVTTTVSPTYAREIQQSPLGFGLDALLRRRGDAGRLRGVINGIDEAAWNPQTDPALYRRYSIADAGPGKQANRDALADELSLLAGDDPLFAFVGRLTDQKGADLIADAGAALRQLNARFVIVGVGDAELTRRLKLFEAQAPERVAFCNRYDPDLVRRVLAGADVLLMPSRFEPCGMLQMYAQRYGTLPVVRATGGLGDTVVDASADNLTLGHATGVLFDDANAASLCRAVLRALDLYRDPLARQRIRECGMRRAFSWTETAGEYRRLYRESLRRNAGADAGDGAAHSARPRRSRSAAIC